MRELISKPLIEVAILALLAAALPYFLPFVSDGAREWFGLYGVALPLIVTCMVGVEWARRRGATRGARHFWFLVNAALACWLANWLLALAMQDEEGIFWLEVTVDLLNLTYYFLLFFAVLVRPDGGSWNNGSNADRLRLASGICFLFVIVVYFIVIPAHFESETAFRYDPTLFTYLMLDVLLLGAFVSLWRKTSDTRWRAVYGLMLLTSLTWLALDCLETAMWAGLVPYAYAGSRWDLLWLAPYAPLVVAVQVEVEGMVSANPSEGDEQDPLGVNGLRGAANLVAMTALLPIAHITISAVGASDPATRQARDVLILVATLVGAAIAWRALRRAHSAPVISAQALRRELALRRIAAARFTSGRDSERRYLAWELQDEVGRSLADASLKIAKVGRAAEGDAKALLDVAGDRILGVTRRMSDLSRVLRPGPGGEPGIVAALRGVCDDFAILVQSDIRLEHNDVEDKIAAELRVAAVRIVRHALAAISSSSTASRARVRVEVASGELRIDVAETSIGEARAVVATDGVEASFVAIRRIAEHFGGRVDFDTEAGIRVAVAISLGGDGSYVP